MELDISSKQAVEDFLAEREGEVSQASHRNYKYALEELIRFCEDNGIERVGDLHGYHLKKYKLHRRGQGDQGSDAEEQPLDASCFPPLVRASGTR